MPGWQQYSKGLISLSICGSKNVAVTKCHQQLLMSTFNCNNYHYNNPLSIINNYHNYQSPQRGIVETGLPRIGFKDGPWLISRSQGRIHLSIKTSAPKTSKDKGPARITQTNNGSNGKKSLTDPENITKLKRHILAVNRCTRTERD